MYAHDDERAIVYLIDPESGAVTGAFGAGSPSVRGDFEGIAAAAGDLYLVTSSGELLAFPEGEPPATLPYQRFDTGLGHPCEIEGLAFDPATASLLLPCKETRSAHLRGHLVVFAVQIGEMRPALVPRVFLPLVELERLGLQDEFHPSAIEVDPLTGHLILASAREETLLELTSQGRLIAGKKMRKKDHPQPEGLTLTPEGVLFLADEGGAGRGRLARYDPIPGAGESAGVCGALEREAPLSPAELHGPLPHWRAEG